MQTDKFMKNWIEDQSKQDKEIQSRIISFGKIPQHVAIIMDGNGRWAQNKGKQRIFGHREGIESVRDIVNAASLIGIKYLTLYAFSIDNWKRPSTEVSGLMKLLEVFLSKEFDELNANNVIIESIGKINALPKNIQKMLKDANEKTRDNTGLTLNLALSYTGRWDISRAMQMIALDVRRGKISPEDLNEEKFSTYLSTATMPDPDLLIRTSGEMRISNFLLWELAYSEIFVSDKLWPEFRREDLYNALTDFAKRERRFGKTSKQIQKETTDNNSYIKKVFNAIKGK